MKAARVYLFADFGGKEPKMLAYRSRSFADDAEWSALVRVHSPRSTFAGCDPTVKAKHPTLWGACRRAAEARAWWLVECESADAGRAIIQAHEHDKRHDLLWTFGDPVTVVVAHPGGGTHTVAGRLLDSGGAR